MTTRVVVRLKAWSGEMLKFRARVSGRPPRNAGVPKTATDVRYFAARVSERSGCEPSGVIPLETWRVDGGVAGKSEWSSVSTRSRSERLEGIDGRSWAGTMAHLWTWRDGGKKRAYALADGGSER